MKPTTFRQQSGFTLIELMIVLIIFSIIAAVAIPSYRQYAVRNMESQAQARMLQLEIELNRWRASALTYKGFVPRKLDNTGAVSYGYDETDNTTIYVPRGSNSSNYRYKITLVDGSGATLTPTTSAYTTAGNSWRMLAEPRAAGITENAHEMIMTSTGVQCKSKNNNLTYTSANCGNGEEIW